MDTNTNTNYKQIENDIEEFLEELKVKTSYKIMDTQEKKHNRVLEELQDVTDEEALAYVEKRYNQKDHIVLVRILRNFDDDFDSVLVLLPRSTWLPSARVLRPAPKKEKNRRFMDIACMLYEEFPEYLEAGEITEVDGMLPDGCLYSIGMSGCSEPDLDRVNLPDVVKYQMQSFSAMGALTAENIRYRTLLFLQEVTVRDFYDYLCHRVIGQKKANSLFAMAVFNYLRAVAEGRKCSGNHVLISGPSGSGKSEIIRATKDFFTEMGFPLPVIRMDIGEITPNGYKGQDTTSIVDRLIKENEALEGFGILALDEFDKRCIPSFSGRGNDVNQEIQGQLLNLIEGMEYNKSGKYCDTTRTMFVGMGSFQFLRDEEVEKDEKPTLGFLPGKKEEEKATIFDEISIEDMMDCGMIPELAGRFGLLISMKKLSKECMKTIVKEKSKELAREMGISLRLSEKAEDELTDMAYTKRGIRGLMNSMKQTCLQAIADEVFLWGASLDGCTDVFMESLQKVYVNPSDESEEVNIE